MLIQHTYWYYQRWKHSWGTKPAHSAMATKSICGNQQEHCSFRVPFFCPLTLPKGNFSDELVHEGCSSFPTAHLPENQPGFLQTLLKYLPCFYLQERVWYCVSTTLLQRKLTLTAKLPICWSNLFSTGMILLNVFTLLIVSLPHEASGGGWQCLQRFSSLYSVCVLFSSPDIYNDHPDQL